jgi:hypothetical protein
MSKFQLYYGENKLHFDNDDIRFDLDTLSWSFIELAHRNNSTRVDMSLHSDTLIRFRDIQPLTPLFYARSTNFAFFWIEVKFDKNKARQKIKTKTMMMFAVRSDETRLLYA